jgi:hypothetical protein
MATNDKSKRNNEIVPDHELDRADSSDSKAKEQARNDKDQGTYKGKGEKR